MKLSLVLNVGRMISAKIHVKCRGKVYPRSQILRSVVPDDKVSWEVDWPEYQPVPYTSPHLIKSIEQLPPWADPEDIGGTFQPRWNDTDGQVNRKSHMGDYSVVNGVPQNPKGRTGIKGRGCLGRWGPNHAADPIVTRWKKDSTDGQSKHLKIPASLYLISFLFVAIKRKDCGEWAIPGGMVDPGEEYTSTLLREFLEETFNIDDISDVEDRRSVVNQVS
ncbi:hypothetical protein J437_LFUL018775, partial [Ladona fulva]